MEGPRLARTDGLSTGGARQRLAYTDGWPMGSAVISLNETHEVRQVIQLDPNTVLVKTWADSKDQFFVTDGLTLSSFSFFIWFKTQLCLH